MGDSILQTIRLACSIDAECTDFDTVLFLYIPAALMNLAQIGIGNSDFVVDSDAATWADFVGDFTDIQTVKAFAGLKVRLMFDPPTNGTVMEAYNKTLAELEWRLLHQVEIQRNL